MVSRGKHQLFRFTNDHTLHTHFRMDGTWRIYPSGRKWSGGPEFQIRAVLATAEHSCVGYRLPVVELIPSADEEDVVGHLGPDLLGPDWDLDEAVRRIAADPERSIGEALLDQRNLAGIGTFYRAELLFLQGIHPRTPVRDVGNLRRLVQRGQQLLYANRWRAGAVHDRRPAARTGGRTCSSGPGSPAAAAAPRSAPRSSGPSGRSGVATGVRGANQNSEIIPDCVLPPVAAERPGPGRHRRRP